MGNALELTTADHGTKVAGIAAMLITCNSLLARFQADTQAPADPMKAWLWRCAESYLIEYGIHPNLVFAAMRDIEALRGLGIEPQLEAA